jgi:dolichol-phosphate mannosyltransferase
MQCKQGLTVSVVSATWNESETLGVLVRKVRETLGNVPHEVIIVDDSSPDGTYTLALELADKAIRKERQGQSIALLTGIRQAKCPIVVTIDADLENDPSNIPRLVEALQKGYDVVVAARPRLPRFSERLFSATVGKRVGVTDVLSNFRAMRRERVKHISLGQSETFGAEFLIRAHKLGLCIGQIQVAETQRRSRPRIGGTVTANFRILKALVISLMIMLRTSIGRSRTARGRS